MIDRLSANWRAIFFFFFSPPVEFPKRRLYAFLDRIEKRNDRTGARTSFEFDCYDADDFDRAFARKKGLRTNYQSFSRIRILTTARRFELLADLARAPSESEWFVLETTNSKARDTLRAWYSQLTRSTYALPVRGYVRSIRSLGSAETPPDTRLRSLSASVPSHTVSGAQLSKAFSLPKVPQDQAPLQARLKAVIAPEAVAIFDVGQANLNILQSEQGVPLLLFDAGFPTPFNSRTAPKSIQLNVPPEVPILLSHWDWDHFAMGMHVKALQKNHWIAPNQPSVSPGAWRFATRLSSQGRLRYWTGSTLKLPCGTAARCLGPAMDRNNSGIVLCVDLTGGKRVLLTGDADFDQIPMMSAALDGLVATHHGGRLAASPPSPANNGKPRLVLSYGYRNVYGHPHDTALQAYKSAGWKVMERTAGGAGTKRGTRVLGP